MGVDVRPASSQHRAPSAVCPAVQAPRYRGHQCLCTSDSACYAAGARVCSRRLVRIPPDRADRRPLGRACVVRLAFELCLLAVHGLTAIFQYDGGRAVQYRTILLAHVARARPACVTHSSHVSHSATGCLGRRARPPHECHSVVVSGPAGPV